MKGVWSDLTEQLETQKQLTQDLIVKMTQEKSSSRLGRIIKAESIGIVVSIGMVLYLGWNFNQLEHWTGIGGAIGMFGILALGIVFATRIIRKARTIDLMNNTYSEVIRRFDEFRALLRVYKKYAVWTSVLSVVFVIPVTAELFMEKNITEMEGLYEALIASLILVPLVLFLITKFYSRNVSAVKKALNDIDFKD